ncbi:MAG: hypothetical protein AAF497_14045, partial [Planctomycetota bacterium]
MRIVFILVTLSWVSALSAQTQLEKSKLVDAARAGIENNYQRIYPFAVRLATEEVSASKELEKLRSELDHTKDIGGGLTLRKKNKIFDELEVFRVVIADSGFRREGPDGSLI